MSTVDGDAVHVAVSQLLGPAGHRYTTARRRIIDAFIQADRPITIPQLLAMDGRLAQSSTYRTITILEQVGAVTRVPTFDDHAWFELGERVARRRPHHLICSDCGVVDDFALPPTLDQSLDRELRRVGQATTFRIERRRLDLLGTCAGCS